MRTPFKQAELGTPITSFRAELGCSLDSATETVVERFNQVKTRAEARYEAPEGTRALSEREQGLPTDWYTLKLSLVIPPEGSLFSVPTIRAASGREGALIKLLTDATDRLIPVTSEIRDEIGFVAKCIERKAQLFDDEPQRWQSICYQDSRAQAGRPAFISESELVLLNEFVRFKAEFTESWDGPRKVAGSQFLGRTGFCWKERNGRFEPAITGSRFENSTVFNLSSHYLEACLEPSRQPRNIASEDLKARNALLRAVLSIRRDEEKEGRTFKDRRERLLAGLYTKYPPPSVEGQGGTI